MPASLPALSSTLEPALAATYFLLADSDSLNTSPGSFGAHRTGGRADCYRYVPPRDLTFRSPRELRPVSLVQLPCLSLVQLSRTRDRKRLVS